MSDEAFESADWDAIFLAAEQKTKSPIPKVNQQPLYTNANNSINIDYHGQIKDTASQLFGFKELRPGQLDVINAVLNKRDALVLWGTGQGKSLCYQLPAFITTKVCFVVSPLLSLMNDQVIQLNNKLKIGDSNNNFNNANNNTNSNQHIYTPACLIGMICMINIYIYIYISL